MLKRADFGGSRRASGRCGIHRRKYSPLGRSISHSAVSQSLEGRSVSRRSVSSLPIVIAPDGLKLLFAGILPVVLCVMAAPAARAETPIPSPLAPGVVVTDSDGGGAPDEPGSISAASLARVAGVDVEDPRGLDD